MDLLFSYIFLISFAFLDYILYNKWGAKYDNKNFNLYRYFQWLLTVAICFVLFYNWGLLSVGYFLGLLFTFNADLWFYFFDNVFPKWFNKKYNSFEYEIEGNRCAWAWWTWWGFYKTLKYMSKGFSFKDAIKIPLSGKEIIIQGIIGNVVVILITLIIWIIEWLN